MKWKIRTQALNRASGDYLEFMQAAVALMMLTGGRWKWLLADASLNDASANVWGRYRSLADLLRRLTMS